MKNLAEKPGDLVVVGREPPQVLADHAQIISHAHGVRVSGERRELSLNLL